MGNLDFSYDNAASAAAMPRVDIFHSRPQARDELSDGLQKAGYQLGFVGGLDSLLCGTAELTGDVGLVDCSGVDMRGLAGLAELDIQLAHSQQQFVITTNLNDLDGVFACFDQTDPQFLIDANHTKTLLAIGRAAAFAQGGRLREMSEDERLSLIRLSEQIDAIARRLDGRIDGAQQAGLRNDVKVKWAPESSVTNIARADRSAGAPLNAALPDPRYVRRIIRQRQDRSRFFDADLFADPAWDMLLDLTAAKAEGEPVSVTSLCIASGVPPTTALRWVKQMVDIGLFERTEDASDKRRVFIGLSDKAASAMASYFAQSRSQDLAA